MIGTASTICVCVSAFLALLREAAYITSQRFLLVLCQPIALAIYDAFKQNPLLRNDCELLEA